MPFPPLPAPLHLQTHRVQRLPVRLSISFSPGSAPPGPRPLQQAQHTVCNPATVPHPAFTSDKTEQLSPSYLPIHATIFCASLFKNPISVRISVDRGKSHAVIMQPNSRTQCVSLHKRNTLLIPVSPYFFNSPVLGLPCCAGFFWCAEAGAVEASLA